MKHALVCLILCGPAFGQTVEPDGYRMDTYRAPVPDTLAGAAVVDVAGAHALWQTGGPAFIDVLPRPPKPPNLPEGTIWREPARQSIPGALWLPNTGYGALAGSMQAYLADGLAMVTDGDMDHPVVVFCLEDCWMSWNAAKRAMELGYTAVTWMPEGTDGWSRAGHPLEPVQPMAGHP